jgi:hypothetical protein
MTHIIKTCIFHHNPRRFNKEHHKFLKFTNEFASILMKLKYKNRHVVGSMSLRRAVAAGRSSHIWVQEAIGEVVSHPAAVM